MPVTQPQGAIATIFGGAVTDQKFASDGSLLVASGSSIFRFDIASGSVLGRYDFASAVRAFDVSADGRYLVAASSVYSLTPTFYRVDLQTNAVTEHALTGWASAQSSIGDVALLDDGSALFIANNLSGALLRFDFTTGTTVSASSIAVTGTLIRSADHDTLLVLGPDFSNTSHIYTSGSGITATYVGNPDPYAGASLPPPQHPVGAVSQDGANVAYGSLGLSDGQLQPKDRIAFPMRADGMAFSPSGEILYMTSGSSVAAVDVATRQVIKIYSVGATVMSPRGAFGEATARGDLLQISDDGRYLAVMTTSGVQTIDLMRAIPIADNNDNVIDEGTRQFGLGGNDTLGGPGNQVMAGGPGNDTYLVDGTYYGDRITEYANEGHDTIISTATSVQIPENVEDLVHVGSNGATLIGSSGANTITGGTGADLINGNVGADVLYGGDGDDTLSSSLALSPLYGATTQEWDAGPEHDSLFGGGGNDVLAIGYGDDADGGDGTDSLRLSFGGLAHGAIFSTEALVAAVAAGQPFALHGGTIQNIETLSFLRGTAYADTFEIATQASLLTIDAGAGDDRITASGSAVYVDGGDGDDLFFSGSVADTFIGGSGFDTVSYHNSAAGVVLTAGGSSTWIGAGGDQLTSVERVWGSEFADTLVSGNGTVELWGGGGDDTLVGGSGRDTLVGMDGDDTIVIAHAVSAGEIFEGDAGFDTLELRPYASTPGAESFFSFQNTAVFQVEQLRFASTPTTTVSASLDLHRVTDQAGGGQLTHVVGGDGLDQLFLQTGFTYGGTFGVPELQMINWTSASPFAASGDMVALFAQGPGDFTLVAREGLASTQYLAGSTDNDTLIGSSGIDVLYGHGGTNVLQGNGGDDILLFVPVAGDYVSYTGVGSTFDGGAGTDVLAFLGAINFQGEVSQIEQFDLIDARVAIAASTLAALTPALALSGIGTLTINLSPNETFDAGGYVHAPGSSVGVVINASAGDETIGGTLRADLLSGGHGRDTFRGTLAHLDQDTIAAFSFDDRIQVADAQIDAFSFTTSGDILTFGSGQSLTVTGSAGRHWRASAAAEGGVELRLLAANPRTDFDGDQTSDILWHNANGTVTYWRGTGSGFDGATGFLVTAGSEWSIAGDGDLTGDGRGDILWRSDTGALAYWRASGTGFDGATGYSIVIGTDWQVAGMGDLDADGKDDIIWRNENSGALTGWLSTGDGFDGGSWGVEAVGAEWAIAGIGDVNGDGRDDLVWRGDNGAITVWISTGSAFDGAFAAEVVGREWQVAGVDDFDGDGMDDVLWRSVGGGLTIWTSNGDGFDGGSYGVELVDPNWQVAATGDYNGDGLADILWRHADGGMTYWAGTGTGFYGATGVYEHVDSGWMVIA